MKSLSIIFASIALLAAASAKADKLCYLGNPTTHGYKAKISDSKAEVFVNGLHLATLDFDSVVPPQGDAPSKANEAPTTRTYQSKDSKGYVVRLTSGGFTGSTYAEILQVDGGGYSQIANLPTCEEMN